MKLFKNAVSGACGLARKQVEACAEKYKKLADLVPPGQYYRWVRNYRQ